MAAHSRAASHVLAPHALTVLDCLSVCYDAGEKRYFVNKDKFDEFIDEHNDTQATQTNEISVQLNIIVELKNVDTDVYYTKDIWIPMTTIYGGVNGVKMFIKKRLLR